MTCLAEKLHYPETFNTFAMIRKIRTYGGYFEAFLESLTADQRKKIQYGLLLLKTLDRLPKKFVDHLEDGIYELRTEYEGNIFRTLFFFDKGNIVVLLNSFQKKTSKTPRRYIELAKQLKKAYYERTR